MFGHGGYVLLVDGCVRIWWESRVGWGSGRGPPPSVAGVCSRETEQSVFFLFGRVDIKSEHVRSGAAVARSYY